MSKKKDSGKNFWKGAHPVRDKWDMTHKSKVAYDRSQNKEELLEELDELEELPVRIRG